MKVLCRLFGHRKQWFTSHSRKSGTIQFWMCRRCGIDDETALQDDVTLLSTPGAISRDVALLLKRKYAKHVERLSS